MTYIHRFWTNCVVPMCIGIFCMSAALRIFLLFDHSKCRVTITMSGEDQGRVLYGDPECRGIKIVAEKDVCFPPEIITNWGVGPRGDDFQLPKYQQDSD